MRAVRYHDFGETDVLQLEDLDRPSPGDGELLIEVAAASINPVDTKFRSGTYEPGFLPMIPGVDVAGRVAAVGGAVENFEEGDRVFGTNLGIDRNGSCAEYTLATPNHVAHLPDNVDFEAGAAVGAAGVTSWVALIQKAGLLPGEVCLVHGGSGGVGHVAVQLAATVGATVTATAAPAYHDRVQELGADAVFDYEREDLEEAIAGAGPPDVILDHLLDQYLPLDAEVGSHGVRVVDIASGQPEVTYPHVGVARGKNLSLLHLALITIEDVSEPLERLVPLLEQGDLQPSVARTYGLDEVADAHRDVLEESFLGKLVVVP